MIIVICKNCSKPKEIKPYRKNSFKYCSTNCKHASMINRTPWNKGTKYTKEQISKLNLSGLKLGHKLNKSNQNWKGEFASYSALHYWIYRRLGKANRCEFNQLHKTTRYHWANISGEYKRDIKDFMPLCPSCHFKYDNVGKKMWAKRRKQNRTNN